MTRQAKSLPALRLLLLLGWMILLPACTREETEDTVFRIRDTGAPPPGTRSLLTAPDIETKKTGITLAVYEEGGDLVTCTHFTTRLDEMSLELEYGKAHTVYALVNMGDQTGRIPRKESDLASLTYTIPSYTDGTESLASRGLPMAGKLSYDGRTTVIPVERLLAKVTADLSCSWDGAAIRSVRVCNLNRTLRPFGEGVMETDWTEKEFQEGTGTASGNFTFYVPENRQGTLSGLSTSADKSPDRSEAVRARSSRLTYLETVVEGTGKYLGTITYRSYLGRNAVSDFDILRGARYHLTVRFLPEGLHEDDWKHENDLTDALTGLQISDGWDDGGSSGLD